MAFLIFDTWGSSCSWVTTPLIKYRLSKIVGVKKNKKAFYMSTRMFNNSCRKGSDNKIRLVSLSIILNVSVNSQQRRAKWFPVVTCDRNSIFRTFACSRHAADAIDHRQREWYVDIAAPLYANRHSRVSTDSACRVLPRRETSYRLR